VQRILRHSAPAITSETYGHLDVEDMRKGLNLLAFRPTVPGPVEALLAAGPEPGPLAAKVRMPKRWRPRRLTGNPRISRAFDGRGDRI